MKQSALYVISEGDVGPIKIGRSVNPWARMADLQIGNPRPLRLVKAWPLSWQDAIEAENTLQQELEDFAITGEWFDLGEEFMRQYVPDFFLANGFEVEKSL